SPLGTIGFSSYFCGDMNIKIFLLLLVIGKLSFAQQIDDAHGDRELFESRVAELQNMQGRDLGDSLVRLGKTFLGTPYVEKTLEIGPRESLVVNLRGLDCTTFVENVLAFGLLIKNGESAYEDFTDHLKTIRYRDGELLGYPSRLHYFTDWIRNNQIGRAS